MKTMSITQARADIFNLVAQVENEHEPVQITSKKGNAILIAESDWRSISETLYLSSIPGLAQSIKEGMETPIADCISLDDLNRS